MSNVVCITSRKPEKKMEVTDAQSYIYEFYDWAQENGIDTETEEFKWEAATIMTIVQGMLHKRDN